jgi:hypothetical protein
MLFVQSRTVRSGKVAKTALWALRPSVLQHQLARRLFLQLSKGIVPLLGLAIPHERHVVRQVISHSESAAEVAVFLHPTAIVTPSESAYLEAGL